MSAVKVTRKVIVKRRSRLKYLAKKLQECDLERAKLDSIALRRPEGLVPRKLLPYVTKDDLDRVAESEAVDRIEPKETICGLPASLVQRALEESDPEQRGKLEKLTAAASDFEFWRLYRQRAASEEEKNCRDIAPRGDAVERMLAQQMAALHRKTMDFIGREGLGEVDAMNQAIRCMRVFSSQVESLKLWRCKGQQSMVVKHITHNVNVGGQAVMGAEISASPRGEGFSEQ